MGVRWGGVCWGDGGTLGGGRLVRWGGGGGCREELVKNAVFWALFGKLPHIGCPWMNVFVRILQNVAKFRVIVYKY